MQRYQTKDWLGCALLLSLASTRGAIQIMGLTVFSGLFLAIDQGLEGGANKFKGEVLCSTFNWRSCGS